MDKEEKIVIDQAFIENRPLSASSLKAFRKSPKHYIEHIKTPFERTDAMLIGLMVDTLALEPDKFEKEYHVFEKATGTGSVAKNKEAKQKLWDKGFTLVTAEQIKTARLCVDSLYSNEMARTLLENKKHVQRRLKWRDKGNNLPLIGYQDFESTAWGEISIVDLKTARNADPDKFNRDASNFDYEIQAAAYLDAYHKKYYQFPYFIFLVVETVAPFNVSINFCDTRYIERAKQEYFGTLKAFRYCMDNKLFDQGYEFRLVGLKDYFAMEIPRYKKQVYNGFDEID